MHVDQLNLLDVYKTKVNATLTYRYINGRSTLYSRRLARNQTKLVYQCMEPIYDCIELVYMLYWYSNVL